MRAPAVSTVAFWLLTLALPAAPAHAGRLDDVRREVDEEPVKKKDKTPPKDEDEDERDDESEALPVSSSPLTQSDEPDTADPETLEAVGKALTMPFWLPYRALGDSYDRSYGFRAYPYAKQAPGYVVAESESPRDWSLVLSSEGAYLDDALWRGGLAARLTAAWRLALDTDWSYLVEDLEPTAADPREVDSLWIGATDLSFVFAQGPFGRFWAGLGVRWLVDDDDVRHGVDMVYGADLFPSRPVVISASAHIGKLGAAVFARLRGTIGVTLRRGEAFAGYDHMVIGKVGLGGPTAGVRLWL